MTTLLILPHQLFNITIISDVTKQFDLKNIIIWEHPHYFTKYNYNKKKLILHRASMKYYYNLINTSQNLNIKTFYIEFHEATNKLFSNLNLFVFDPIDKIKLPKSRKIESPNFLINTTLMKEYRTKTEKFFFQYFYTVNKQKLNIIPNIKSKDKYNRKPLNNSVKIPKPFINHSKDSKKYVKEAIKYIKRYFPDNLGNVDNFQFPITHNEALRLLKHFIKNKFSQFGPYQDAISNNPNNNYMFHSLLSSSINIGLINPSEIIELIMKYKKSIPVNSFEGFIRQLFWREYQRYCYKYYNFNRKNYFNNTKNLTKEWYTGRLNIEPVDNCIKKAFNTGYLHHIERLMIIGNYMNLSEIKPSEGFRWFMEFSCDSYEWVMHQNVYDMVFFVSGGATMRRPYLSSSNYILKMSDYKCGDWCEVWNKKYRDFIKKNYNKLASTGYYGIKRGRN